MTAALECGVTAALFADNSSGRELAASWAALGRVRAVSRQADGSLLELPRPTPLHPDTAFQVHPLPCVGHVYSVDSKEGLHRAEHAAATTDKVVVMDATDWQARGRGGRVGGREGGREGSSEACAAVAAPKCRLSRPAPPHPTL